MTNSLFQSRRDRDVLLHVHSIHRHLICFEGKKVVQIDAMDLDGPMHQDDAMDLDDAIELDDAMDVDYSPALLSSPNPTSKTSKSGPKGKGRKAQAAKPKKRPAARDNVRSFIHTSHS
jgi:hypothetical protein